MFRKTTEYERACAIYKYLSVGESFDLNRDLGDIYQISSDGVDLKFYDMVKVRRTNKLYRDREIILLNVTPYGYVNLEGRSKWNLMQEFEYLFTQILFGFKVDTYKNEAQNNRWSILARKYKGYGQRLIYRETDTEYEIRSKSLYDKCLEISRGLWGKYEIFFIGDDHQMVKPLDFTGYFYYLARCLNNVEHTSYCFDMHRTTLEFFFGSDHVDINERYHSYIEIANILGVTSKINAIPCRYNSLEQIQNEVKSRIYIFYEVAKYFFKNNREFSEEDHKNILKRSYNIRAIYSALGGKYCMKKNEEKKMIAYFTALRCTKDDLPLLMNTNDAAMEVLKKRFDLSR
jgi:hypothetical protein